MNESIYGLGTIWLLVGAVLAFIVIGYYAVKGFQRQQQLVKLGEERERELILRDDQERMIRR